MRLFFLILSTIFFTQALEAREAILSKKENVAGMFYADDAEVLKADIEKFFNEAQSSIAKDKELFGIIAPHAGYVYSGPIAAYSYKELENRQIDTVIVMAPSHYFALEAIATFKGDAFETPLGQLSIDNEIVDILVDNQSVIVENKVFEREHALEVQLPFLKYVQNDVKIVPLILGQVNLEQIQKLARNLAQIKKEKNILLVTSTDLSHYHSYDKAKEIDGRTIKNILELDSQGLINGLQDKSCEACGYAPLLVSMHYYSLLGAKPVELFYANSGDTAGDKDRVVGYVSIAAVKADEQSLQEEDKKVLLKLARETLEEYLKDKKIKKSKLDSEIFNEVRGAFVTLHKNGQLRGCIGNYGNEALKDTIVNMAISAATKDPRFNPLNLAELDEVDIEISVLSPLKEVDSADEIVLGKHGVIVSRGFRQGVFLPQVADETGWTKEEFLSYLCEHKAGLPADAWKDSRTKLKVFTADVFSENEFK